MGYLTISTNARRYQTHHRWHFFFQEDSALVYMHCACNIQSNCCGALDFLFLKQCAPNSPSWTHWLQDLGSHTAACLYELWVKKTEEIKERLVEFWQCTDTAFEWKMRFSCFPVLPGSAEAHVILGDIVNWFLIAYFMRNISAKRLQNVFKYVKVIAKQRWDVFWWDVFETQCSLVRVSSICKTRYG